MNHGWEHRKLCDVAPAKSFDGDIAPHENKYWCLNLDKIESDTGRVIEYDYLESKDLHGSIHKFSINNVLFSKLRPNLNKVVVPMQNGYCSTELVPLCPIRELNRNFLSYYLRNPRFVKILVDKTGGAKMPRVKMNLFWDSEILLPNLEIQNQIVSELDKLNELIEIKRNQLKDLDTLAQSLFYETFGDPLENSKGWQVKSINDIADVKIGPFGSILHKEDYISGGTPLINPIHMQHGYVKSDRNFSIDDVKKKTLSSYILKTNDIIFGRRGDIGRCALIRPSEDGYLCGTGSLFIRFHCEINSIFSIWYCMQPSISKYLIGQAKGATMLNINCGIIASLPFFLPPIQLQNEYAAKIEAIEGQKKLIESAIADLETLLASRMDYWFND